MTHKHNNCRIVSHNILTNNDDWQNRMKTIDLFGYLKPSSYLVVLKHDLMRLNTF